LKEALAYSSGVDPRLMALDLQKSSGFKKVPVKMLKDILKLERVYKSPYSMSFYDRKRQWNVYEDGLVRFSNHWNFKTEDGKFHGKTTEKLPGLGWAKGVYDIESGAYVVIKQYDVNTLEDFNSFIKQIKL